MYSTVPIRVMWLANSVYIILTKKHISESNVKWAIDQRGRFGVDVCALNLKI